MITVSQEALILKTVNASHCPGDSVQVNGTGYTTRSVWVTILSMTGGCDTIATINIAACHGLILSMRHSVQEIPQAYGAGIRYPTGTDTINSNNGLYTIVITITEDPLETLTVNNSHCPGDCVLVYGEWYIGPASFIDTYLQQVDVIRL
jgi:hypothetical protein